MIGAERGSAQAVATWRGGHVRRDAALALRAVALRAGELNEHVRAGGDVRVDGGRAPLRPSPATVPACFVSRPKK